MRLYRNSLLFVITGILSLVLSACNLTTQEALATATPTAPASVDSKPLVAINSPASGATIRLGGELLVNVTATDDVGVTRIQLFANNQPVKSVSSDTTTGDRSRNVVLDYSPIALGNVTLRVVAFRGAVASDPAEVQVQVVSTQATATTPGGGSGGTQPLLPTIDPNDTTCRAQVTTNLNMRSQPFIASNNVLLTIPNGQVAPIIGRLGDNSWWQVRYGSTVGWVSASFTNPLGNCTSIPVIAVPPTAAPATATPTITVIAPTATFTPTITPTPGIADLIITQFNGAETAALPEDGSPIEVEFSVNIVNNGSNRTGNFITEIRVLPDGARRDTTVANLRPGEAVLLTFRVPFDRTGTFTVVVEADSTNVVQEISDANNSAQRVIVITQK